MKALAWLLLAPLLLTGSVSVWFFLSADWRGPDYVVVPVVIQRASIEHTVGGRYGTTQMSGLKLLYGYQWEGLAYQGWRFSCERLGGDEVMFRTRDDELDRTLQARVQQIKSANPAFAWVDRKQPGNACLYKDGQPASR